MAVFLNNKVGVKVNSVDLSDHVQSVTLNRTFDELEVTAMGDSGHKFVKGLEASSVTIDFSTTQHQLTYCRHFRLHGEQTSQLYFFRIREQQLEQPILFTQ